MRRFVLIGKNSSIGLHAKATVMSIIMWIKHRTIGFAKRDAEIWEIRLRANS